MAQACGGPGVSGGSARGAAARRRARGAPGRGPGPPQGQHRAGHASRCGARPGAFVRALLWHWRTVPRFPECHTGQVETLERAACWCCSPGISVLRIRVQPQALKPEHGPP